MPVDDFTVFDFVAINANTGDAVLVIADHLEWDEENRHPEILIAKIYAYLDAVENGALYAAYPDAINRNIVIEVKAKYAPNLDGRLFLGEIEKVVKRSGHGFIFSVLQV